MSGEILSFFYLHNSEVLINFQTLSLEGSFYGVLICIHI